MTCRCTVKGGPLSDYPGYRRRNRQEGFETTSCLVISIPTSHRTYLRVLQAMNVFSRYGGVFLLYYIGLHTCVAALRQVGTDSVRMAVGIAMMPRGEVGLVFASVGKGLGVVSAPTFSAIVLMVIVTTLATPPCLSRFSARGVTETLVSSKGTALQRLPAKNISYENNSVKMQTCLEIPSVSFFP